MDTLTALPIWVQLLLGVLAAVVLVVLNAGWLLAAKSQLDERKRKVAEQQRTGRVRPQGPPTRG
jgi:Tfp pilus assembly protein PilO